MAFKILVIDDDIHDKTDTISSLPALLEKEGYDVAATADGENQYDLVFEARPDLIVLTSSSNPKISAASISRRSVTRAIRRQSF